MQKRTQKGSNVPPLSGATVEEFLEAERRVKGKPYASLNLLRWLLEFSYSDIQRATEKDRRKARLEALVFAYDAGKNSDMPLAPLPTEQALIEMRQWLQCLWAEVGAGKTFILAPISLPRMFTLRDGFVHRIVPPLSIPWPNAFRARVDEILASDSVRRHLRFCLVCRRPFCASKRQAYCTPSCSQKHRTREWRQKNRERFRAARRAAYKRKVEEKLGRPVKIGARSKRTLGNQ
jgi:hypothetical protein